jgi:hypothetical protein
MLKYKNNYMDKTPVGVLHKAVEPCKITNGVLWSLLSLFKAGLKKGKIIPVLNDAIKHYAMKAYG